MSDQDPVLKPDRPALPRDSFRSQRTGSSTAGPIAPAPVVITPNYPDAPSSASPPSAQPPRAPFAAAPATSPARRKREPNPFQAYGERTSSRPYALRLPDAVDLVLRQLAAEERTHPLRIVDRVLHDYLKRIGRLPPIERP